MYFEEVVEGVADEGEEEGSELVDQIGVPREAHVEKIEADAFLAEDLVDQVLAVVVEAFVEQLLEGLAALLRHLCIVKGLPESLEMRVGLMRSSKNSVSLWGFFSQRNMSLGSCSVKVLSMLRT